MKKAVVLKKYKITADLHNKIIDEMGGTYLEENEIAKYSGGFSPKSKIYYTRTKIICPEYILNYYENNIEGCTSWKQCICEVDLNIEKVEKDVNPLYAYNYVYKIINTYYTETEIDTILKSLNEAPNKQIHELPKWQISNVVYKYSNCYHYDLHKAHASALGEIFPKAKKALYRAAIKNKKYCNLFVGYLNNHKWAAEGKAYEGAYWWIVKHITDKILTIRNQVGGKIIYFNTDGFVVQNPDKVVPNNDKIGEAGLDTGDCYFVYGNNYWLIQMNNDLKGNCLNSARDGVDLSKGIIPEYNIECSDKTRKVKNLKLKEVDIYEES